MIIVHSTGKHIVVGWETKDQSHLYGFFVDLIVIL